MCGRFGFFELSHFIEQLRELDLTFDEVPGIGYRQSWNITPDSMVVTLLGDHGRYWLGMAHWGLIPHCSAEMPKRRPINARAESFAARPFFRHMLNRRHCIIPASGFYEWKPAGERHNELWYIHRKDNRPVGLASLWDEWQPPGSAIAAAALLHDYHDWRKPRDDAGV